MKKRKNIQIRVHQPVDCTGSFFRVAAELNQMTRG